MGFTDRQGNSGGFLDHEAERGIGLYGDGNDGAATLDGAATVAWASRSGSTYTLTRNAYTTNVTINSGVILVTDGFRLIGNGTFTNNGTVHSNGNAGSGATAGAARAFRAVGGSWVGGAGQTTTGSNGTSSTVGTLGGAGGAGGASGGNAGGTGGTVTAPGADFGSIRTFPECAHGHTVSANQVARIGAGAGGGGGGGDGTNAGGGGGSGGGYMVVLFKTIANNGTISANGGAGANGTGGNAAGGGGGGGGVAVVVGRTYSGSEPTASGGAGGTGQGTGSNGTAGSSGTVIRLTM